MTKRIKSFWEFSSLSLSHFKTEFNLNNETSKVFVDEDFNCSSNGVISWAHISLMFVSSGILSLKRGIRLMLQLE